MMDVQVLPQDRLSESGESLTRLVQEQTLSRLDLLVRESLQNSLDASKDRSRKTRVDVDFITGKFKPEELTSELGYLRDRLNARYTDSTYDFLAIRDSGTTGLTGSNDVSDDRSKLQSLVYHIGKNQKQEGSGGSWGLGKTTFYRIGIGIVAFYSRTFEKGEYCSKLAVAYIDTDMSNPLITEENSRGIAFFGKYDSTEKKELIRNPTVPITDTAEIGKFLDIFGIKQYEGEETGTTVIMPYVNFQSLLREVKPPRSEIIEGRREPTWCSTVEEYLSVSIQRWYSPRLANPKYEGSWLKASINGDNIAPSDMHPLFHLLSDLYKRSSDENYTSEFLEDFEVKTAPIRCRNVTGQIAGYIGAAYIDPSSIGLTNEYFRNAYSLIGDYNASIGSPIITFCRKPGMLVRYVTSNSPWIPRLKNVDEDKILICVFKLASEKRVKDSEELLEEYVRKRERADHNNWENENSLGIIEKISENVSNELKKMFNTESENKCRTVSDLSSMFAELFLPKKTVAGATVSSGQKKRTQGKMTRKAKKTPKSDFSLGRSHSDGKVRTIDLSITPKPATDSIDLYVVASSERGSVSAEDWENEFDSPFPLSLEKVTLREIHQKNGKISEKESPVDLSKNVSFSDGFTAVVIRSALGTTYGVDFKEFKPDVTYRFEISVNSKLGSVSYEVKCTSRGREQ